MDTRVKIICFYHEYEEYGCFSNWYPAPFEYAGRKYSSVEQYMMYQKVIMFREYDLAQKILDTDDPAKVKKLGRTRFERFDAAQWDRTSYTIVKRGIRAKFEQNPELLEKLLATEEYTLAECSARDTKWGIGIAIDDEKRFSPKHWRGQNLLGRILMEVRDDLRRSNAFGIIGYQNARDLEFDLWNQPACVLFNNPKYHNSIKAYSDTLCDNHARSCFLYDATLHEWEVAMNINMGGGLPAIGFWEMKQDIFDIFRMG